MHVEGFWSIKSIEVSDEAFVVGAHVSEEKPVSHLETRKLNFLHQGVHTVASLAPHKAGSWLGESVLERLVVNQKLGFVVLLVDDNGAHALVNSIVDVVVDFVPHLLLQEDLGHNVSSVGAHEAAWLSDDLHSTVLSWEDLLQMLVNLWSHDAEFVRLQKYIFSSEMEVIGGVVSVPTSNVEEIHRWHADLLGEVEDSGGTLEADFVAIEGAATCSDMEGNSSDSHAKLLAMFKNWQPERSWRPKLLAHGSWGVGLLLSYTEDKLGLREDGMDLVGFFHTVEGHEVDSH